MGEIPGDAEKEWWRGSIIYQIYPRSFMDASGDGVGDLAGITQKLDYVASLGVDAIWISPFFRSPMKDFGYDVSDYLSVDPIFGTMDDFDQLVAKATELDIKVMIDQVLSHTSDEHPWFRESRTSRDNPKADWYIWADPKPDGSPPNNWLSIFGGIGWKWDSKRMQYYYHNFLESQPDLNLHNPEVQQAILNVVEFWLKRGVRGFRLDTVNFYFHDKELRDNPARDMTELLDYVPAANPYQMQDHIYDKTRPETLIFLERFREMLDKYGDTTSVGEMGAFDSLSLIGPYTENKQRLHMVYTFHFMNERFSASHFRRTVEYLEERIGNGWPCWAFANHDVVRAISRWGVHQENEGIFARLLIGLLTSLRGSYCLYQGEELGLTEAEIPFEKLQDPYGRTFWPDFKGRDGCRTPMPWSSEGEHCGFSSHEPWLPIPDKHRSRAVDLQDTLPGSILNHYRHFIKWRKQFAPLRFGNIKFYDSTEDHVLAFEREWKGERILCVFNLADHSAHFPLDGNLKLEPLDGHGYVYDLRETEIYLQLYSAFFARIV